ncbi:hypothetical protein M6B38_159895 [Iris pallida]|uniref:Uncharacterized protein n=1 Tax=Iris pallida TaxID=29817 RepID=A0AAX6F045_IRIPA|nr:hypothetical protein M6B38_159895 [Iris pallida]
MFMVFIHWKQRKPKKTKGPENKMASRKARACSPLAFCSLWWQYLCVDCFFYLKCHIFQ